MSNVPASNGLEQQLREACARLVRQTRAGKPAAAEELLTALPEIATRADLAVELIYTEFVTREQLGQQPACDDYLARFPQYRAVLEEQFDVHRLVNEADEPTAVAPPLPGGYEILEEIARGSTGVVYRAQQRQLKRPAAIKMIQTGPHVGAAELERFRREAETVARLAHANIVQVYDVGEQDGRPFLAFELITGGSLADRTHGQPQPPRVAAELVETLARAMQHAHQQGIVHRDLKPANILMQPSVDGSGLGVPKIADFGLARLMESPAASLETATLAGTPSYMAPEQAKPGSTLGPAVDVYALGAILYEMLTGRPPFLADTPLNTLARVVHDEPVAPRVLQPGLPIDVVTICLKCLSKEPRQRYASAEALADDLRRFREGRPIQARPVGRLERAWKWARRYPAATALIVVSTLALGAVIVGVVLFTLHLREVAATERSLKAEALAQAEKLRTQLYSNQLAQVGDLWDSDPGRGLALLNDPERCPPELRDFAWHMFNRLCRQDRQTIEPGVGDPLRLAISADGKRIAVAGTDTIAIENLADGQRDTVALSSPVRAWRYAGNESLEWLDDGGVLRFGRPEKTAVTHKIAQPWRAVFSPNGRLVALQDRERRVQVVEAATGKVLWRHEPEGVVNALAFSSDGRRLAWASGTRIQICEIVKGSLVAQRQLDERGPIDDLAFSPDGESLAVAVNMPHLVLIVAAATLETSQVLPGHVKAMRCVRYSPDGTLLAAAGDGREVKVWRTQDYELLRVFKGHTGIIRDLAFAPAGTWLATVADDRTLRCWDMEEPVLPARVAVSQRKIVCLAGAGDERAFVIGDDEGTAHFIQAHGPPREIQCHEQSLLCLALTPDARLMATGSLAGQLRLWNVHDGKRLADLPGHEGRLRNVAFSADGRWLASVGDDGVVRVWEVATRTLSCSLNAGAGAVRSVSFQPSGTLLAAGNDDGTVSVWDLPTRKERIRLPAGKKLILISLFSPDGRTLACGGLDFTVSLWDTRSWERRAVLAGHTEYVFAAVFSPDSQTLATGSGNRFTDVPGEVKLWNVPSGQLRATLRDTAGPVAFDRAGRVLASVDDYRVLKLWPGASASR